MPRGPGRGRRAGGYSRLDSTDSEDGSLDTGIQARRIREVTQATGDTEPQGCCGRAAAWVWARRRTLLTIAIVAAVLVLLGTVLRVWLEHVVLRILHIVAKLGPWQGPLLLIVIDFLLIPLLCPSTVLNIGAGILFKLGIGYLVAAVGCLGGATIAFFASRFLFQKRVERVLKENEFFQLVNLELEAADGWVEPLKIVTMIRLPPVFPFTLFNWALGTTKVGYGSFLLGTWVGLFPGTFIDVYLGTLLADLADASKKKPTWYFIVVFAVTAVVSIAIFLEGKRMIRKLRRKHGTSLSGGGGDDDSVSDSFASDLESLSGSSLPGSPVRTPGQYGRATVELDALP